MQDSKSLITTPPATNVSSAQYVSLNQPISSFPPPPQLIRSNAQWPAKLVCQSSVSANEVFVLLENLGNQVKDLMRRIEALEECADSSQESSQEDDPDPSEEEDEDLVGSDC